MSETLKTLGALILLIVALPIAILSVVDKFRYQRKRTTAEEREAKRKAWIERLRRPQFEEVEKICGGLLPSILKLAYQQGKIILSDGVELNAPAENAKIHYYFVGTFLPLDAECQKHTTDLGDFGRGCCFAGDGMGNFYWVPVSDNPQIDAPVYFACHDPYGNEKVANSLKEFFSWFPNIPGDDREN